MGAILSYKILGTSWMLDKFPRTFQYFDCAMPFFIGICGTFSDLARAHVA